MTIAVAIHGIEPSTFERCALIRDWLGDHGIDKVTLLVIPARDLHPVGTRSPGMIGWLEECRRDGDSIAQHGFQHSCSRSRLPQLRMLARSQGHRSGEFVGLDGDETRRAVHAGWRVLKLAGVEPDGFVAPAYAYTPALRQALGVRFRWWADLLRVRRSGEGGREPLAPAWSLASSGPLGSLVSPQRVQIGALLPTSTLRIDVHPADLQHPRRIMALERVIERSSSRRTPVTYSELAVAGSTWR
jgi:predicted deacetylase